MAKRSLEASTQGIIRAKQAIARKHLTQQLLAEQVGLKTRQPIGRFLAGKAIDRSTFMEICFQLDLDWQEIAAQPQTVVPHSGEGFQDKGWEIDSLVQQMRSRNQKKLQAQCGTLQMWAVSVPMETADIYIDVNILQTLPNQQWLEIPDLVQGFDPTEVDFDHWGLNRVPQERIPGLEVAKKCSKLMVLGKPGTGKTTFLKYLALKCNQGTFQPHRLPIFFCLKYLVNKVRNPRQQSLTPLQELIYQEFTSCGFEGAAVETLLDQGRFLILLDGLDEVPEAKSEEVLQQINQLSQTYYQNQFVISSRLAAWSYRFPGFTEVEIADFTSQQIEAFAKHYFVATARTNREEGLNKASLFIEQLEQNGNRRIRELVTTPLLLNLACVVFQAKAKFPTKHSKLYEEGLNILLVKWDQARGIKRDEAYWSLSLAEKIKLLNQVGFTTFDQGEYFFEQSKIQQYIADYLRLSPEGETDPVVLQLDSEVVLKSIESQHGLLVERSHGVYSFSHLTFQEYFTARYIATSDFVEENNELLQHQLVRYITEKRWREVFFLVTDLLPKADELLLLMKQQADRLIASDEKLQQFLRWVIEKSQSGLSQCKPAAVRALYFALALALDHYFSSALRIYPAQFHLSPVPYFPLPLFFALALTLDRELTLECKLTSNFRVQTPNLPHALGLSRVHILDQSIQCALRFDLALVPHRARELLESLQVLKAQLPNFEQGSDAYNRWWQQQGQAWIDQLIDVMGVHRQAGHDWQFSEQQRRLLQQYHYANQLLVDCLNSNCNVTPAVRAEIEARLFLLE